jgi:TonB family protein
MIHRRLLSTAGAALGLALTATIATAQGLSGLGAAHVYGPIAQRNQTSPSDAEVMAAWPAAAKAKNLGGSAVMHCQADPVGALSNCQVMLERSHAGFGQALLSLAPKYHFSPPASGGWPDGGDVVISATWPAPQTAVDWVEKPKPGDFSTTLTVAAWRAGGEGQAVMNCLVAKLGALHDCMVVYQAPAGKGFGTMALRFQGFLRLKPATVGGEPIASSVDVIFHVRAAGPRETP